MIINAMFTHFSQPAFADFEIFTNFEEESFWGECLCGIARNSNKSCYIGEIVNIITRERVAEITAETPEQTASRLRISNVELIIDGKKVEGIFF